MSKTEPDFTSPTRFAKFCMFVPLESDHLGPFSHLCVLLFDFQLDDGVNQELLEDVAKIPGSVCMPRVSGGCGSD